MFCALCSHACQSALPGTFQVEAEDWKLPQEKRVSYFTWSLPPLQPISHAHLGIFQATPIGTILPLWEKCNIWLVKLTIISEADNERTTYLLIIPVRGRQLKILLELHWWISQKNPPLCCSMSRFHPSQPIFLLQCTESKGLWSVPGDCWSLSHLSLCFAGV